MAIRFPDVSWKQFAKKADWTPRVVPDGETFTVPADQQVLYTQPIELEGDAVIQIDGTLIEVD